MHRPVVFVVLLTLLAFDCGVSGVKEDSSARSQPGCFGFGCGINFWKKDTPASADRTPPVVSLGYTSVSRGDSHKLMCSGAVLPSMKKKGKTSNLVITTASCANAIERSHLEVMIDEGRIISVVNTMVHENYTRGSHSHNIAIVKLNESVQLDADYQRLIMTNSRNRIMNLLKKKPKKAVSTAITASWRYAQENGDPPYALREYNATIVNWTECDAPVDLPAQNMLCVDSTREGASAGTSSGAPLYVDEEKGRALRGLFLARLRDGARDLYLNVAQFEKWIMKAANRM